MRLSAIRAWPWYPMLIAAAVVMGVLTVIPVAAAAAVRPLLLAMTIGTAITVVWVALLGRDRGGAAAAITVVALVEATSPDRLLVFLAALCLVCVEAAWSRRSTMKRRIPWPRVTAAFNILVVVLVLTQVVTAILLRQQFSPLPVPSAWTVATGSGTQDIFLILADGHGRRDVLTQEFGYDMQELTAVLASEGFVESPDSYANHALTRYSLSVLLNGRPFAELGQDLDKPADENLPYRALPRSSGMVMLEAAGYETIVVASGFDHLSMRDVDRYVDIGPRAELEEAIWGTSAIGQVIDGATGGYIADTRTRLLDEAATLRDIAAHPTGQPQFVLAHLPAPHYPIAVRADCSLRPQDGYSFGAVGRGNRRGDEVAARASADQTRCVDSLLADIVRDLVDARPDAVVVVFSDHGPDEGLDWIAPDVAGTHDRLANLFWARTPGHDGLFPKDITLVNVLPIIANAYFGTNLPLHANDLLMGPTQQNPYFVPFVAPTAR